MTAQRAALVCVVVAASSCVPDGPPVEPRGAAGVHLTPSATSRGDRLATADGWDVAIEAVVVRALLAVSADANGGVAKVIALDGSRDSSFFIPAIRVGRATVSLDFDAAYLDAPPLPGAERVEGEAQLPPATAARLRQPEQLAETGGEPGAAANVGPSVIVRLVGRRGDRVVRVDVAFAADRIAFGRSDSPGRSAPPSPVVDVVEDDVRLVEMRIAAEELLVESGAPLTTATFGPFDEADADRDGVASPAEILKATIACTKCEALGVANEVGRAPLSRALKQRARRVIVPRP